MKLMNEMSRARLDTLIAIAPKYAEFLGKLRTALQKSGFSSEEAMLIVLKVAEQPVARPFFGGPHGGHWHKR